MKKLTIFVDMDDTLELLLKAWLKRVNEIYGRSVCCEDVREWDLTKAYPGLSWEQVYGTTFDKDFWKSVEPMPGAVEGLKALMDQGHEVYVATASLMENIPQKFTDVLFRYFPYLCWDQVIVTSKKQLLKGDVLIDDGVHNLLGGDYAKLLMDAPYNRDFDEKAAGMIRVRSWDEVVREVTRLAEEKE